MSLKVVPLHPQPAVISGRAPLVTPPPTRRAFAFLASKSRLRISRSDYLVSMMERTQ
jgi:hypothetical protein